MSFRRVAAVVVPCVAIGFGVVGLPAAASADPGDVVVVGHGWGHGRGLGQYGAYGYAVEQGWSSARILDHFYGGTKAGTIGNAWVTVRLSSLDGPADPLQSAGSWITSSQDFFVGHLRVARGSAVRIARSGNTWLVYATVHGCAGGKNAAGKNAAGKNAGGKNAAGKNGGPLLMTTAIVTTAADPGEDTSKMLTVCANGRSYRGQLNPMPHGTSMSLVNGLRMESYLRGVVPRESPAGWGDAGGGRGMAALQAQAVAARGYARAEHRYLPYARTCDTTSCQVYGGAAEDGALTEDPRTDKAIAATAGQVRVNAEKKVVRTEFSSSTGGWTEPGGLWPAVRDAGDTQSPRHTWTTTLDGATLASRYGVGAFSAMLVTAQNGLGAEGGRAKTVKIVGSATSRTVSASQFASDWNLNSDWFFPVDQPHQQVTSLRYVKAPGSAQIYRQFYLASKRWTDYASISTADWTAKGSPPVKTIGAAFLK